jgi:hypothetical protein
VEVSFLIVPTLYLTLFFLCDNPPHIHAEYQGQEALIEIKTGIIMQGKLPKKALKIIKDWCIEHQEELLENWEKTVNLELPKRIKGADND